MSEEEAFQYLKLREIDEEQAAQIYKLVGGRTVHLSSIADKPISEDAYYGLVGADTGDKLLETNIFALRYNSHEVTFQSTVMKRYCEENSALWEGK